MPRLVGGAVPADFGTTGASKLAAQRSQPVTAAIPHPSGIANYAVIVGHVVLFGWLLTKLQAQQHRKNTTTTKPFFSIF